MSVCTVDKSYVKISQNFVAFSEYTNFIIVELSALSSYHVFEACETAQGTPSRNFDEFESNQSKALLKSNCGMSPALMCTKYVKFIYSEKATKFCEIFH